jgi:hypothetical protein
MRVFFPSLDGSPQYATILQGCGLYPLILFVHGDCNGDADHYLRWHYLPQEPARAGYVVAVPELRGISAGLFPPDDTATQATLLDVLSWMRQDWEYSPTLMPAQATGLAGHSYGGMHAGIVAMKVAVAGVVSLSGTWGQWLFDSGLVPITELQVPQLFTWGTGGDEAAPGAILPDNLWGEIAPPKHKAVFAGSEHFDYLYEFPLPCRDAQGPCPYEGSGGVRLDDHVLRPVPAAGELAVPARRYPTNAGSASAALTDSRTGVLCRGLPEHAARARRRPAVLGQHYRSGELTGLTVPNVLSLAAPTR